MECREPDAVYKTYEAALRKTLSEVRKIEPGFGNGLKPAGSAAHRYFRRLLKLVKSVSYRLVSKQRKRRYT
jgi:hypothetical protein